MKKILEALTEMQVKMPIQTVLIVLLIAFIVSLIIYLTYKHTYSGVLYNPRFNVSLIMITMITTIVMVVIGSNISVSLGMVGALSIIRFRTAVKDPRDTAFIFWCVVSGLACGTQNYTIVVAGSLVICAILFLFKKTVQKNGRYVLVVKGYDLNTSKVEEVIGKETKAYDCKGRYIKNEDYELIYDIKFGKKKEESIIKALKQVEGVNTINIIQSNTDTMG
jgi:uncharacterized membrane protein YhiD involved in acid resistance